MNEMIIYADDITQIVQKKGSENNLTRETEREIIKINQYENKWKIKTNVDKFQIIPIGRKLLKKLKIDKNTYEFANRHNYLLSGTIISKNGFTSHITSRINLSMGQKGTLSYIPALLIKQGWTTKTMRIIEDK